jgi:predicted dienelactone hydrolase
MTKFWLGPLLLTVPLLASCSALHVNVGGRDVAVWKPAGPAPADGFPVVIFSHGFTGCNTQSVFLMEALAQAGYLMVAPNHADAHCGSALRNGAGGWRPEEPFQRTGAWSEATYRDRRADIEAVLDGVLSAKSFQGVPVDGGRVGIAGHSLGGYTALAMAGAWASWKDPRIKAVLALSPFNSPFVANGALGHMNVPVLYQGGTLDLGISPTIRRPDGAYDRSSAPKYYVEFRGAGHLAWTDLNPRFHGIINRYSVAFFNRYLKESSGGDGLAGLFESERPREISLLRSDVR